MSSKLPIEIKKAIKNDKLAFFIGSGASTPLGFPTWDDLINDILLKLSIDKPSFKNLIPVLKDKTFSPIEILEKIKENRTMIYDIIKDMFDIPIKDEQLFMHKKLWNISGKIITTNYDTALESANPKVTATVYTQSYEITHLNRKDEYLIKMHGSIDDLAKCILFEDDYKRLYTEGEKSVLFQLKKILTDYTIVFLGFSLQDPYVTNIFESMNKVFDGFINTSFIISTADDNFSRYNTKVIKIKNWGNSLDELLDEMIKLKLAKNIPLKVPSTTLDHIALDTVSTETPKAKIALLLASPIDKPYEFSFSELTKNFANLDVSIDCLHLSLEVIHRLENYDYFIIFSRCFKNKICIEDEYLKSDFVSLKTLEENIYWDSLKAVFLFTNDDIEIEPTISLPFIIYKQEKSNIKNIIFKLFRKYDRKFIDSNCNCINLEKLEPIMISSGNVSIINHETSISNSIDTKTLDFIGRKLDLEIIIRKTLDLRSSGQILTIKGSGGIGKTMISKKVAFEFSKRGFYNDGIDFIDLEHIENYIQFEDKIAQCFGLDKTINFKEYFKLNGISKNNLIILDNFETLLYIKDSLLIKELLKFISDYSTIILTSRESVFGNSVFENIYPLRDFTSEEAVELFLKYHPHVEKESMQILKKDIIENLLNKNPLAVKIIASNLPEGKSIKILHDELEKDFFNTLDKYKDDIYIKECDENIEKSQSLYQSINYSYKKLKDKEKLAFELLSLFPDRIDMEDFKSFFVKSSKMYHQISDTDIKSLQDKSLLTTDNRNIGMQSIIRRFAEYQFNQRLEDDKWLFYKEAFSYNSFMLSSVLHINKKNDRISCEIFDKNRNNFIKCISYINKFDKSKITKADKLEYINDLLYYITTTNSITQFLAEFNKIKIYFDDMQDGHLLTNLITNYTSYYLGDFENSYKKLNEILSFNDCSKDLIDRNKRFEIIFMNAFQTYSYEGKTFEFCKWMVNNKDLTLEAFNVSMFELGKYTKMIVSNKEKNFFDYEKDLNEGKLCEEDILNYINKLYSKDHLEKMQIYYLKCKIKKIDKKTINNLVITNPYTSGLQSMMYALIENDVKKTIKYYINALKQLEHIKYFYVECIYYLSSFLKDINNKEYDQWVHKGYILSQKYYYGFLIYKFEYLLGKANGEYNEDNYSLPEKLNLFEHIHLLKDHFNIK